MLNKRGEKPWPVFALMALFGLAGIGTIAFSSAAPSVQPAPTNSAPTFTPALPGYQYQFPRDHAAHPDYKTEWWYYTGHLKTKAGRTFGYELTFFRVGTGLKPLPLHSPWSMDQLYLAHFALTDDQGQRFYHTEQLNRAGIGRAGASSDQYRLWNKTWSATLLPDGHSFQLQASMPQGALKLRLQPAKPLVIQGQNGISQKADCTGCASHYYSFTRLLASGEIIVDGHRMPVTGLTWMDHEFGSNQMTAEQVGWDWFSIQLDDGSELMLYRLRRNDGSADPNSSGTWIPAIPKIATQTVSANVPPASSKHIRLNQFTIQPETTWTSPITHGRYPSGWKIFVPTQRLSIEIKPTVLDQELAAPTGTSTSAGGGGVSYWEGRCRVTGTHNGKPVQGQAYVELTGYAGRFKQRI